MQSGWIDPESAMLFARMVASLLGASKFKLLNKASEGGMNEKIEGFLNLCAVGRRLGEGVLLKQTEEAIELLTGIPADSSCNCRQRLFPEPLPPALTP